MNILLLLAALSFGQVVDDKPLINNFLTSRTVNCWILDSSLSEEIISVSATGFGHYAYVVAAERGFITRKTALDWINTSIDAMIKANRLNHGWYYHFLNPQGKPAYKNEPTIDSIDSIIFVLATIRAAERLKDNDLLAKAYQLKNKMDIKFMLDKDGYFYHYFKWNDYQPEYSRWRWVKFSEGVLAYRFFNRPYEPPAGVRYDMPTFCYVYPLAFYDDQIYKDRLGHAIDFQISQTGRVGFGAMQGFAGYEVNSPYLVSPLMASACKKYFPNKVKQPWDFTSAQTLDGKWKSSVRTLIDDGAVLMILNKEKL